MRRLKINIYRTTKTKIQRLLKDRELSQARSKPNRVDRPVRTARTTARHCSSTQYCNSETVLLIFPFLQTNITSQMWPNRGNGDKTDWNQCTMSASCLGVQQPSIVCQECTVTDYVPSRTEVCTFTFDSLPSSDKNALLLTTFRHELKTVLLRSLTA